nr:hypothetical protein [Tanacetum cinerariifolium]
QDWSSFFLWGRVSMGKRDYPMGFLGLSCGKQEEKGGKCLGGKCYEQCMSTVTLKRDRGEYYVDFYNIGPWG